MKSRLPDFGEARSCTDFLGAILFIGSLIGTALLGIYASRSGGNVVRFVHGTNMQGLTCGVDFNVSSLPLAAWPYPPSFDAKVCVASCDETNNVNSTVMGVLYASESRLFHCLPTPDAVAALANATGWGDLYGDAEHEATLLFTDLYTAWPVAIGSVAAAIVLTGVVCVMLRSFAKPLFWIICLALVVGSVFAGCILLTWPDSDLMINVGPTYQSDVQLAVRILGGVLVALGAITLLICFAIRKQIDAAIDILRYALQAVWQRKTILFVPFLSLLLALGYLVVWLYVLLLMLSVEHLQAPQPVSNSVNHYSPAFFPPPLAGTHNGNPDTMVLFDGVSMWRWLTIYHAAQLVWTLLFLIYFAYAVFGYIVAAWYFSDFRRKHAGTGPTHGARAHGQYRVGVCDGLWTVFRYHCGTVAIAALVLTLVQLVQAIFWIVICTLTRIKNLVCCTASAAVGSVPVVGSAASTTVAASSAAAGAAATAVTCCCCCPCAGPCNSCGGGANCGLCGCNWANDNALLWSVVWDQSFCGSCGSAMALMMRHARYAFAVAAVSRVLLWITRFAVGALTALVAALVLRYSDLFGHSFSAPLVPVFVAFLIGFIIASVFAHMWHAAIDAIFFCFLTDIDINGGPALAPLELRRLGSAALSP